jgi:hypothetical protein
MLAKQPWPVEVVFTRKVWIVGRARTKTNTSPSPHYHFPKPEAKAKAKASICESHRTPSRKESSPHDPFHPPISLPMPIPSPMPIQKSSQEKQATIPDRRRVRVYLIRAASIESWRRPSIFDLARWSSDPLWSGRRDLLTHSFSFPTASLGIRSDMEQ